MITIMKDKNYIKLKDFAYEMVLSTQNLDNLNQSSTRVIFLIGWTGCKDRHLSKYSSFYESRGFSVIRYSPSAKLMFGFDPEEVLTQHATKLIDLLQENHRAKNQLYFHFFSNGGAVMYYLITKQLEKLENSSIAGCIFDSCPALMTNKTTLEAIASIVPGNFIKRYLAGAAAIGFLWFSYGINKFRDIFTGNPTEAYRLWVWYSLLEQRNISPQLFLYSKGDKIADYASIETFIDKRKELGVITDTKVWDDSIHICHYKSYPEEYTQKLEEFLNLCEKSTPALGKIGISPQMGKTGFQGDFENTAIPVES